VADKDEEGTAGEPTPADPSSTSSAGAHALGHPESPRGDEVVEPTGDELAASGYDTAGRDDLADLEGPAPAARRTDDDARVDRDADADVDRDADALEPVAAGTVGRGVRPARERRPAPQAKGVATAGRDRPVRQRRTTPVGFVKESVGELRKVVYPTGQQLLNYFVVVLVFVLFVIAYVSLLDLGMGWAIFRVFS
jgi:preprotein translocase subunit SecE